MPAPMTRMLLMAAAVWGLAAGAGCRAPVAHERIAAGDDDLSFFGAGRGRLDFEGLPVIQFERTSWRLAEAEAGRLGAARAVLAGGGRLLVVGVGDDDVPSEHGRQQALARALTVRSALARQGADASRILVTGVAAEESSGLTGQSASGPRVECAVIR